MIVTQYIVWRESISISSLTYTLGEYIQRTCFSYPIAFFGLHAVTWICRLWSRQICFVYGVKVLVVKSRDKYMRWSIMSILLTTQSYYYVVDILLLWCWFHEVMFSSYIVWWYHSWYTEVEIIFQLYKNSNDSIYCEVWPW